MKYSDDELAEAVRKSRSIAQVMRYLGIRYQSGSMYAWIGKRIGRLGVDTSHFLGQGHAKGRKAQNRLTAAQVLVYDRRNGRRESAERLRRALAEVGVEYRCSECGLEPRWRGKPLRLQVDHLDGDALNNLQANLRFLCPNCHTQQETSSGGGNGRHASLRG